jgi:hypothetical protein
MLHGAERQRYGLVPGAEANPLGTGRLSRWLDRRAGLPATEQMPALFTWLTDRLDDLAGASERDGALTFGDLWAGSVEERPAHRSEVLHRAAAEPEHRVIDLVLVATDLSSRRPYRLPFLPADAAERLGGARFLFCEPCLTGLIPGPVIAQMIKAAPSTDTDHPCPRHSTAVLR